MTTIELDPLVGVAFFSLVVYAWSLMILANIVMKARIKYDVPYPTMYDNSKPLFNCAQRAHMNAIEWSPIFILLVAPALIVVPLAAAILTLIYTIARVLYAIGYATGDPEKRHWGFFHYLVLFALTGVDIYAGLKVLGIVG